MSSQYKNSKPSHKKYVLVAALAVLMLGGAGYALWRHQHATKAPTNPVAKTTSNRATAQSDYTSGKPRAISSSSASQGGAIDNNGTVKDTSGTTGQPISAASGLITLESPTNKQVVSSGDQIYGKAQVDTVQFQLIDDQTGLLAQGSLKVVNGKFAGSLQFTPHGSSGKLNVFSQDSPSSPEINIISVPIGLK